MARHNDTQWLQWPSRIARKQIQLWSNYIFFSRLTDDGWRWLMVAGSGRCGWWKVSDCQWPTGRSPKSLRWHNRLRADENADFIPEGRTLFLDSGNLQTSNGSCRKPSTYIFKRMCVRILHAYYLCVNDIWKATQKIPVFHVCSRAILSESWQGEKSTTHKSGNLDEMRSDKMPVLTAEGDQREVLQEINVAIRLLLGSCWYCA